jgi:hypothetical protein
MGCGPSCTRKEAKDYEDEDMIVAFLKQCLHIGKVRICCNFCATGNRQPAISEPGLEMR